ncbi:MAG TPA: alpha-amylase family glycosyl hydrolase [Myxococcales bacterium]
MATWARDAVVYHLFPMGLCGAPPRNDFSSAPVPRLEALRPWIRHARELGANTILLGPVLESSAHGYDTANFGEVDRRLGTTELVQSLVGEAHGLGMKVLYDAVFGHVGRDFWAFRDVREHGASSKWAGWFKGLRFDAKSPLGDPFGYECWKGAWELPRLELKNPAVREHLFGNVDHWVRTFGFDGLRLDTADWLDLDFLEALRAHCDSLREDLWLMGEVVHGDYRKQAHPRALHSVTNYECSKGLWSSLNDRNYFEIAYALNRQFGTGGLYRDLPLYAFADNHDVDRAATSLKRREDLPLLYALLFTMPGVPSIYYGSEFGLQGRRTATDDRVLRPRLTVEEAAAGGDAGLSRTIQRLIALRQASPALRRGDYTQQQVAKEQLVFLRSSPEQTVLVGLNCGDQAATLDLALRTGGSRLRDLAGEGPEIAVAGGRARITIEPHGVRLLELR